MYVFCGSILIFTFLFTVAQKMVSVGPKYYYCNFIFS